jgi:hypothetical protein
MDNITLLINNKEPTRLDREYFQGLAKVINLEISRYSLLDEKDYDVHVSFYTKDNLIDIENKFAVRKLLNLKLEINIRCKLHLTDFTGEEVGDEDTKAYEKIFHKVIKLVEKHHKPRADSRYALVFHFHKSFMPCLSQSVEFNFKEKDKT